MAAVEQTRKLTQAEYLDLERVAPFKSEFLDGEMFAMAGGTRFHSLIATNLAREVGNKLQGRPCLPYNADLRVKVEATGLFTYPDLSVVCGPAQTLPDGDDTLVNPTVLVEVLSSSTEAYDRGQKFFHYQQIPSLREYLLVSQAVPRVERFMRGAAGQWTLQTADGLGATLELPSLGITVTLAEIYSGVEFPPPPPLPVPPPRR